MFRSLATIVMSSGLFFAVSGCQNNSEPPAAAAAGGSPSRTPSANGSANGSTPGIMDPSKSNNAAPVPQMGTGSMDANGSMMNQGKAPATQP